MGRTGAIVLVAAALFAAVLAGGCGRHYRCAAHGDVSALADWQARGMPTAHAEVCEASDGRFDAVQAGAPSWAATYRAIEDALDARGFTDSPRRGYAQKVGAARADATFERCEAHAGGKLLECSEELRLRVVALPSDARAAPFTVEAERSTTVHHYIFGERADGPIPTVAHSGGAERGGDQSFAR
jgi:hypothetical protein